MATTVPTLCSAQSPSGTIAGRVLDTTGAAIRGAEVVAVTRAAGHSRRSVAGALGTYILTALLPGDYDVTVAAAGFQRIVRMVTVAAGTTTTADFLLPVGDVSDAVTVRAATPAIQYDAPAVGGLITADQIASVPLNGRSVLELAKLEPGVQPPSSANRNRTVVEILETPAANVGGARFVVDGGSVTSIALGGAQMTLSQEAVQEFQVSTVNFDLTTGMTDAGAVNVLTRAGGNERHSTAFYFFRDHHLAAYPALVRDLDNSDPFFQRRQFGMAAGGPVRRNRVFYFASWERNDQRAVSTTTLLARDFAHLSRVTASPLSGNLLTMRLDARLTDAHTVFARHSRDESQAFGPAAAITGGSPNAYPSNWNGVVTDANQSLVALTSVVRGTIVNDLRVSWFGVHATLGPPRQHDCPGCLGLGTPSVAIAQAGVLLGHSGRVDTRGRRFHLRDAVTWQLNAHRLRIGADWERNGDRNLVWNNDPIAITLFSPERVRAHNALAPPEQMLPLPASFQTVDDILKLPLRSVTVSIGDPATRQQHGGAERRWNTIWLFADDSWRLHQRLTLTYGLGWSYDGVLNHDLRKPLLLAPLLGGDALGATRKQWTNFSPVLGAVWALSSDRNTVLRAGASRHYRPHGLTSSMDAERAMLGPPGLGRQTFVGSSIFNPLAAIPGVPVGTPLDFGNTPSRLTGADAMAALPAIVRDLAARLARADAPLQQIQINKQAGRAIFPERVTNPSAVHFSVGGQSELLSRLVVSADLTIRRFVDVPQNGGAIDLNRFGSARGPVIPKCSVEEANDPHAFCSTGPVNVYVAPYRFINRALVARVEKRFSSGWQALASYAFSRNSGTIAGSGFNLDNWRENSGPIGPTHTLNISGVTTLPLHLELGFNFSYSSAIPFSVFVSGVDFNGDGTPDDLLPGTTANAFNRGMARDDLRQLVDEFNERYAGTRVNGTVVPRLTLPSQFAFGDNFHALDLRVSRQMITRNNLRVVLIGEAFNVYNAANLAGHSGDVTNTSAFGQPTMRATQVFGSGGPRAFQLAARVRF